jgi:hypothetical protein
MVTSDKHRNEKRLTKNQLPAYCNNHERWENQSCACEAFDHAVTLLLQREESLLRDVVEQCGELVDKAYQQAHELEQYLDNQK